MNAILTAAVIGTVLLALAIWIEIRDRRVEPGMAATGASLNADSELNLKTSASIKRPIIGGVV